MIDLHSQTLLDTKGVRRYEIGMKNLLAVKKCELALALKLLKNYLFL